MRRKYLLGEVGTLKGKVIPLDKQQTVFGRDKESCDFVFAQPFISHRHAVFQTDDSGQTTVRDLGSRLGTFVNGKLIQEHLLVNGDQIGFGPGGVITVKFFSESQSPVASANDQNALRRQLLTSAKVSAEVGSTIAERPQARAPKTTTSMVKSLLRVGRAPDNDVVLNASGVSRYHASLSYSETGRPVLTDLGSTNGTYVNGELLKGPRTLESTDLVFIGGFLVRVDGRDIHQIDLSSSRIYAEGVTKQINGKVLIKDITLALLPREFIGLMGPSGCGKSTLMDALNGLRPATSGAVYLNDLDLYRHFNAVRRSIGYVPQRDILHEGLSVERTLFYSAKLRLPEKTPDSELYRVVEEVIETVGLKEQRVTQFRQLSGGQQKRLSLGIELITKPSFLFLDEPTSPLDPETTESMMVLFRQLADQGRIVVLVTHKFEKFFEMHHVAFLARGGHLVFFGPPKAALEYFGCKEPTDIYRRIGGADPEELSRRFKSSQQYALYVSPRVADTRTLAGEPSVAGLHVGVDSSGVRRHAGLSQWWTLTLRFLETKLKDSRNTALLLLQAPIIALILVVITGNRMNDVKALFISAIIAIWFGANNAVRDIVAETPIYVRERRFSLKVPSYVLSKFTVLSGIALIQCLLFLGILIAFKRLSFGDFFSLLSVLYLTSLGGISTALLFSAWVNTTEKAMSILPLLLIPQLLLSGFLMPVDDLYLNGGTEKPTTVEEYNRFQNYQAGLNGQRVPGPGNRTRVAPPDPVRKIDGLGVAKPVSVFIMARWSTEALVHAVSVHDTEARDQLATQISVQCYQHVLKRESPSAINNCYRRRVLLDLGILAGFNLVFLGLTMWTLKKKDIL